MNTVFTGGCGELVNSDITVWYQKQGIEHITTPPNTSKFNMVKGSHQTLCEDMKPVLKESGLSSDFWVDALYYAVNLKYRS